MFHAKSDKKQKIFFYICTSIKILENINIKDLQWSKADDLSKEKKRDSKERYSTNFSSSHSEVHCKKGVLKNSPPVYWHITKIDINPLSANPRKWQNTLKQFVGNLPTNCLSVFDQFVKLALKGLRSGQDLSKPAKILISLTRSRSLFGRNHSALCFSRQMPNT